MDTEFYNLYVEKILNEVGELNKTKLLQVTTIAYLERRITQLEEMNTHLHLTNEDLTKKIQAATEKADKKAKKTETANTEGF